MKGYDPSLTQGGSLAHYRLCYIRVELAERVGIEPTVISLTGYRIYHLCFLSNLVGLPRLELGQID